MKMDESGSCDAVDGSQNIGNSLTGYSLTENPLTERQVSDRVAHYFDGSFAQETLLNALQQGFAQQLSGKTNLPDMTPNAVAEKLCSSQIPSQPIAPEAYTELLNRDVVAHMVNVAEPAFIGHMTTPMPGFIPPLQQFLSQANQNVVKVETAKSATFLERQVLAMLHRQFFQAEASWYTHTIQHPQHLHGIVTSGGSLANLTALFCARNKALLARGVSRSGLVEQGFWRSLQTTGAQRAVILVSRLAHYSVRKSAAVLGLGSDDIVVLEQDEQQRANVAALTRIVEQCRAENTLIIAMIGIAGATETGTVDPLNDMASVCEQHGIHFHVDAAWGGGFMFSAQYRHKLRGIERADSITLCGHKQLFVAQGLSVCLLKNSRDAFAIATHAEYQSQPGSFDLGQFTLEGSRAANAVQLHAVFHLLGEQGLGALIDDSMERTAFMRTQIKAHDAFDLVGDGDLNILNYRYIPRRLRKIRGTRPFTLQEHQTIDAATEAIQQQQFNDGRSFISKTRIWVKAYANHSVLVFRAVLLNPNAQQQHIEQALQDQLRIAEAIEETTEEVSGSGEIAQQNPAVI